MMLLTTQTDELNGQLRTLLSNNGISLSLKQIQQFFIKSYQQCVHRLQRAAVAEGLIDKKISCASIGSYLEQLKLYSYQHQLELKNWKTLHHELNESIINQTLALAYQCQWHKMLKQQAKKTPYLWSWLKGLPPQELLNFLEQWGCTGHPYHPNFRAKMGFSRQEILEYSPEFNAKVSLSWSALHRSLAYTSTPGKDFHWLFSTHFPKEYSLWREALRTQGVPADEYYPLPLHPWQWTNKLKTLAEPLVQQKQFIVNSVFQVTKPSMSFRTMMPLTPHSPHLKLAVGVHTTSSLRTVSPASVANSSSLSQWLNRLLAENHYYKEQLFLARDLAGIHAKHPSIAENEKKHLALIVRENPLKWLQLNQKLIPLAALFKCSPLSSKFLLSELIELSSSNPVNYFMNYARQILRSQLHLLLVYGIALEAHQQNTLIIIQDNRSVGIVIRDLGGIKICQHALYDQVEKPKLHPDSTITCTELKELSNKFIHGNLLSNLAPCIDCLVVDFKLDRALLWQQIKLILEQILEEIKPEVDATLYHWHHQQLLVNPWQHKSLLTMRLHINPDQDLFSVVNNPLSKNDV
ncbi:IucA/IucC family siderophore biosynthesis protein [Legionella sp. km772]|uniref:IucA/IucC family protein n=1 Tax=Legionella sp. km772 TaxID=2498111 RepID=UPI000F8EF038|nr:IucA/IucC family protein [Legionella sp. km772]RUR06319.1 IucA/IucC family siderophore biosynthesis protein [Legionella sp. km772]